MRLLSWKSDLRMIGITNDDGAYNEKSRLLRDLVLGGCAATGREEQ